jgi:hypothetical protein
MEHLFSQLFKALHSEYPQEEAQPKEGKWSSLLHLL